MSARCEQCGQLCLPDAGWTVKGRGECCRGRETPAADVEPPARLFEPAAEQLAGQLALDGGERS